MSSFPIGCNVAHVKRYGNARSIRQMSEPNGVTSNASSTDSTRSPSPVRLQQHHHSVEFPTETKQHPHGGGQMNGASSNANVFGHPSHAHVKHPLTRHMQQSLKLDRAVDFPKMVFVRSISVDAIVRNVFPELHAGRRSADTLPTDVRSKGRSHLSPPRKVKENNHRGDSGFGSSANLIAMGKNFHGLNGLGISLANNTDALFKLRNDSGAPLQSVIEALQNFGTQGN